jgi:two-component system, NarL family, sensor histidine kinase UhpB
MRKALSLFFLVSAFSRIAAQVSETDSLINLLQRSPEDTTKVHLYWNIGASIIYQDPQKAIPWFKQGTALAMRLGFISGMEKCLNATSFAFSLNAKYDSALVYINYAIPYAIKAGNIKRLSLAYLNRADVYTNLNELAAALKDCDTAIQYAEKINNNDALGRIHSIMNGIYTSLKQYGEALAAIDRSDKYFAIAGNRRMIAMNYSERAEVLLLQHESAKAIPYLLDAIVIADSLDDIENLSAYHGGLAEAYYNLKKYNEATSSANKALEYSQQTGNTRQEGGIYQSLSNIESAKNNFPKAIEYGVKAFTMIREEKDLEREEMSAASLAEVFFKAGDTKQAFHYLKISRGLRDSLVQRQLANETARLQTTFNVKQKDKEIELLNKNKELQQQKLQKQRLMILVALLLIVLGLSGTWLLINRNKLRGRMKELELRNRIAADLHDEVGSSLSSIHMLSQMVTQQDSDIKQKDVLQKMSSNAKETMDKMGDIVWMIKPGESEGVNLKQRMERFAYEICSSKNISPTLQLDELEKVKLTMHQRKNLYLVFKEAINNAVKYSGARKVDVNVVTRNKQLILQINDNGNGFDPNVTGKGNGLDNMRNRAQELNGKLHISSAEGEGTSVELSLPL